MKMTQVPDAVEIWESFQASHYMDIKHDNVSGHPKVTHAELPEQVWAKNHIRKRKLADYRPSRCYRYTANEIDQYNTVLKLGGAHTAKEWADRQWRERDEHT